MLHSLARTRKQLVEARVASVNQLRADLQRCFPGAIGLFARLDSDVTIAFPRRNPIPLRAPGPGPVIAHMRTEKPERWVRRARDLVCASPVRLHSHAD